MSKLAILGSFAVLAFSTSACSGAVDEEATTGGAASAVSSAEVDGLAAQFGLGQFQRLTRDSVGNVVRSYKNVANPALSSSSITTSRDDRRVLRVSYPDPAGDDFTVDGVFLQAAWQFGLKNVGQPLQEEGKTTWHFANGTVVLRPPTSFACTGACPEGATPDELRAAMANPKPGKLGSTAGYVASVSVSDGVDPTFLVDEASLYLAYRYRTRLGKLVASESDELKQVFEGGEIAVKDEGAVTRYTIRVKGLGDLETCTVSAVSPTPTCRSLH